MNTNKLYFLLFLLVVGFNSACSNEKYKAFAMNDDSARSSHATNNYTSMVTNTYVASNVPVGNVPVNNIAGPALPPVEYSYNYAPPSIAPAMATSVNGGEPAYSFYSNYNVMPDTSAQQVSTNNMMTAHNSRGWEKVEF